MVGNHKDRHGSSYAHPVWKTFMLINVAAYTHTNLNFSTCSCPRREANMSPDGMYFNRITWISHRFWVGKKDGNIRL